MSKLSFRFSRKYLATPYAVFLLCFIIVPLLLIIYYAFTNGGGEFSLNNLNKFFTDPTKLNVLFVSLLIGFMNTAICLIIGYPLAYFLASRRYNINKIMVLLFIMPMWINFVLRTGATRDLLVWIGLGGGHYPILATMIGMAYNYLPFVILPLYTTMLKMDQSLIEAASDLGATPKQVFFKTVVPLSSPGIVSAATMVFMPTMSSYVISDVLSEGQIILFGNSIYLNFSQGQWNDGSFMAFVLLVIILVSMLFTKNVKKDEDARGSIW